MRRGRLAKSKGISLIALVVTIIVLLILAGVSISALTGNNGVVNTTISAKESHEISGEMEIVKTAVSKAKGKSKYGGLTEEKLKEALKEEYGEGTKIKTYSEGSVYTVEFTSSGRIYKIDVQQDVEYLGKQNEIVNKGFFIATPRSGTVKEAAWIITLTLKTPFKVDESVERNIEYAWSASKEEQPNQFKNDKTPQTEDGDIKITVSTAEAGIEGDTYYLWAKGKIANGEEFVECFGPYKITGEVIPEGVHTATIETGTDQGIIEKQGAKGSTVYLGSPTIKEGYTVKFNTNEGSAEPDVTATEVFDGWKVTSGKGSVSGSVYTFGDGDEGTVTATWTTKSVTLPTPARSGYEFEGSYEDEELTQLALTNYTPAENNKTLYAKWKEGISTSILAINPNGGKVKVTPQGGAAETISTTKQYAQEANTTVAIEKPTKDNKEDKTEYTVTFNYDNGEENTTQKATKTDTTTYTFSKWITAEGFKGTLSSVTENATYTFPTEKNVTSTITATYKENKTSSTTKVTLPTPTKTGYAFVGWYNAETKVEGTEYTPTANVTLTAHWIGNNYTVTYNKNANDATGTMPNGSATFNTNFTPAANGFTRAGYTFTGSSGAANGSGTVWTAGTEKKYETAGDITLYAQWTANTYTITLTAGTGVSTVALEGWTNTGTATMTKDLACGSTLDLSKVTVTNAAGYNGATWAKTSGAGSLEGTTFTVGAGVTTLTVTGTPRQYTVTYDKNAESATGTMANGTATYNENFTPAANVFINADYIFMGWNEKADGTGTKWTAGEAKKYTKTGNMTLYAQWKQAILMPGVDFSKTLKEVDDIETNDTEIKSIIFKKTANLTQAEQTAIAGTAANKIFNVDKDNDGLIKAYKTGNSTDGYIVYVVSDYDIYASQCGSMFYKMKEVTNISFDNFDTTRVTSMQNMFYNCEKLANLDISNLRTATVTNMQSMFYNCKALTSLSFGQNFNTSSVTNMQGMFQSCSGLTTLDVSNFVTNNVTKMGNMFNYCRSLNSLNVSNFNTANVTNMSGMFYGLKVSTLDISNFNTAKVTNMSQMFAWSDNLTTLNLGQLNTAIVENMSLMFYRCDKLPSLDLTS